MREIRYRPRNVRETLVELKDTSELAVDLAYSAVLSGDAPLADEVVALEDRVRYLQYHARIALMLAARNADDAERLVGVFQVVATAVDVTHAAGDVARVLTRGIGHPVALRAALPEAPDAVVRATLDDDAPLVDETLDQANLQVETGCRVVAVRRGETWHIGPEADTTLRAGDILILSGPDAGVADAYERITGGPLEPTVPSEPIVADLDVAVELVVRLKTLSEVAVGLAYGAALFDSDDLAREVWSIEERSNAAEDELERWVIDAVPRASRPHDLRGLLHLANASEAMCNAARGLAEAVLRDVDVHPVFAEAVRDSNEVIAAVTLDGSTPTSVDELEVEAQSGIVVLAVRRDGDWTFDPGASIELADGDTLVIRGPKAGVARLRRLVEAG